MLKFLRQLCFLLSNTFGFTQNICQVPPLDLVERCVLLKTLRGQMIKTKKIDITLDMPLAPITIPFDINQEHPSHQLITLYQRFMELDEILLQRIRNKQFDAAKTILETQYQQAVSDLLRHLREQQSKTVNM